ncbi:MAG: S1-like domain-containing RNA-binding protein [Bacteroidales bacterium]
MIQPGKINTLRVVKTVDFGIYLDGGEEFGEILMPGKWVPAGTQPEDTLEAFLYYDSEDRLIATTTTPKAMVDDFALLRVSQVNRFGAFLDWGLEKDLLVPYGEQIAKMIEGHQYLVYVYTDPLNRRIVASARLDRFLDLQAPPYREGDQVELIVWLHSDMGYKAIINRQHTGMLYQNEVFQPLKTGMHLKGYIGKVREDNKIDLVLQQPGYEKTSGQSGEILKVLHDQGGFMPVTDKSPANEIYDTFHMSKKNFKKALGALYRHKKVVITPEGIRLKKEGDQ